MFDRASCRFGADESSDVGGVAVSRAELDVVNVDKELEEPCWPAICNVIKGMTAEIIALCCFSS